MSNKFKISDIPLKYILAWLAVVAALALLLTGCVPGASAASHTSIPPIALAAATTKPPATGTPFRPAQDTPLIPSPTEADTQTPVPSDTPTITPLPPEDWQNWAVIPTVSPRALEIYQKGLAMGTDPHKFSKVGDCQNITNFFLGVFETPTMSRLGEYEDDLRPVLDYYAGSFARDSAAVKGGYNVASVLNPISADPDRCEKGETPLACEIRENNPSIIIISMETWWAQRPADVYEKYMREIIEYSIDHGALPILATKADNLEGDQRINATVAKLASEYQIPLWNFWRAVQDLPGQGVSADGFHLTFANSYFDDPKAMEKSWPIRNLTALQALDAVWRAVSAYTSR